MIDAVLIGAGQRGRHVYGEYALASPDELRFVAVADPSRAKRDAFADLHNIPPPSRHADWAGLLTERIADVAIIASPDVHHAGPAVAALEAGYEVLLEKPMAHSLDATAAVVAASRRSGASINVSHVLRYTPFFRTLHDLLESGAIGDIVTVEHRENVAAFHMAHSFVRGNWARSGDATPMIVAKCCHDFDILAWNLDDPVTRIQSFGSLLHFRPERAPRDATERCTDGCAAAPSCPFDAQHIYLDPTQTGWPVHVITDDLTQDGRLHALRTGPYGRCVYTAGSDVVDHQTVNMELVSGATATLTMHGHSHDEYRSMRYDGTTGTIRARAGRSPSIELGDHRSGQTRTIEIPASIGGHGGGDPGLIAAFLEAVRTGSTTASTADVAFESHVLAFAAEQARLDGTVIDMHEFREAAQPTG
jgi:predicted dehydrogenase